MMKYLPRVFTLFMLFQVSTVFAQHEVVLPKVAVETELGLLVLEINTIQAPNTAKYFLSLVKNKILEGASFYRVGHFVNVTHPQLLQGGPVDKHIINSALKPFAETKLPSLANFETTLESGLTHQYATISLARDLFGSGDAIPDLVIALQHLPQQDYNASTFPDNRGYPAFGRVIQGMDIVKEIAAQPTTGNTQIKFLQGQILTKPIKINRVYLQ